MSELPVVAAIPNYNMGKELTKLLPQLTAQDYNEIYVLDDASTDDSRIIVESFDKQVHFVPATENKGAGAARNRIIGALAGRKVLIHFIDADTILETDDIVEKIRTMMPHEPVGFVGGLVNDKDGLQNLWNYGPRQSLRAAIGAQLQTYVGSLLTTNPDKAARIRRRFGYLLADRPDPLRSAQPRSVFWCIEANLVIQSDVFTQIGGFDEALREHEIQDLAIRLDDAGLKRYFNPLVAVRHTAGQVRNYNRNFEMAKAEFYISRKHGLLKWLFG